MGAAAGWGAGAAAITQGLTDVGQAFVADRARRKAQRFAESVMQNQYQWAAKDLEKAGLNRVLAITQPHATAQSVPPVVPNFKGGYAQAAAAAIQAKQTADLLDSQVATAKQAAREKDAQADTAESDAIIRNNQAAASFRYPELADAETQAAWAGVSTARSTADKAAWEVDSTYYQMLLGATQLQLERSKLPSAAAVQAFDQTPQGRFLQIWNRGLSQAISPFKPSVHLGYGKTDSTVDSTSRSRNINVNQNYPRRNQ